ncbi:ArsR/SmtB family transcription factor [Tautonia plasticadhaerens]|uniref:Helix-turn-helix domain protein n=1 Tax=Tautonia plasticadhaerens TaxID=2527974 RepID=A0A518GVJ6_9BACT|nr:helix-turn-helix domain-containing protein [Tautonia plasticadhaerens]QDV32614.1 Helix-turn-helix domain protein [Tautonia plasticadhaerens]
MRQLRHPEAGELTLGGVLRALSDPVRLRIVATLAGTEGERAWGDFDVEVCASTLSHHMKALRLAGVIVHRKEGTRCFVSLRRELEDTFPGLLGCILRFADGGPGGTRAPGRG